MQACCGGTGMWECVSGPLPSPSSINALSHAVETQTIRRVSQLHFSITSKWKPLDLFYTEENSNPSDLYFSPGMYYKCFVFVFLFVFHLVSLKVKANACTVLKLESVFLGKKCYPCKWHKLMWCFIEETPLFVDFCFMHLSPFTAHQGPET